MAEAPICDLLAALLKYPDGDYLKAIEECQSRLQEEQPGAAGPIGRFARAVRGLSHEQRQELFVQTFDLNPVCVLEVGWHLYGDTYDRGPFLATMRQHMRRFDVKEDSELPDHLTHTLAVLGRMEAQEANRFAAQSILPALEKMLAGLKGKANPYEHVLRAIQAVLLARQARVLQEVKHD